MSTFVQLDEQRRLADWRRSHHIDVVRIIREVRAKENDRDAA